MKFEGRQNEVRRLKLEGRKKSEILNPIAGFEFRSSVFFQPSGFGLRIS
jgi:hypothetical protein